MPVHKKTEATRDKNLNKPDTFTNRKTKQMEYIEYWNATTNQTTNLPNGFHDFTIPK